MEIKEIHGTAGNDVGAVALQVEKLTDGTARGAGIDLLATAFNLKATANTLQTGTLVSANSSLTFNTTDYLALKTSGTLTSLADVVVTIKIKFNV
jgi:hypothetical protein